MEGAGLIASGAALSETFERAYELLAHRYPIEYVLLNEALCEEMKAASFIHVLREFAISGCKADLSVFHRRSATGVEVKSQFDRLDRLPLQLKSYQQAFATTFVVVAPQHLRRVLDESPAEVGVRVVSASGLQEVRPACESWELIRHDALFAMLRKREYLRLVHDRYGVCPSVPSTKIYRACLAQFRKIDVKEAVALVSETIWARGVALEAVEKHVRRLPKSLRALAMTANFTPPELLKLGQILELEAG